MERRKIVWIVGMAYSGSSLLNLLLDTQPAIRGIGEGAQVYSGRLAGGPCSVCRSSVGDCSLYSGWNGSDFYRFNFHHYGCSTIVDSSKSVGLFSAIPREPYDYRGVFVSKAPQEAVHSLWKHHPEGHEPRTATIAGCFSYYFETNRLLLEGLKRSGVPYLHVHYRDLAVDRVRAIHHLTDWLEEPFSDDRLLDGWYDTDTHVLGGNPALVMQVTGDEEFSFGDQGYLEGKYHNRHGEVFLDRAWAEDGQFLETCRTEFGMHESSLRQLLPILGYDYDQLVVELDSGHQFNHLQ